MKPVLTSLLLATTLALSACGGRDEAAGTESGLAARAVAELREELAKENLKIGQGANGLPLAELSPAGDLIIGGETIPLDPSQRALVLSYREQLAGVALSGADIGVQGAALAGTALTETAKGALMGDAEAAKARIEAEAEKIKAAARALCDQLPALRAAQEKLAAAVPAFAPYAKVDAIELSDCNAGP